MKKQSQASVPQATVEHHYHIPPVPREAMEVVGKLAEMATANANALRENAVAIQKITEAVQISSNTINVEASAFTAKNGACMNLSGGGVTIKTDGLGNSK